MAVYVMSAMTRAVSWTAGLVEGFMQTVVGARTTAASPADLVGRGNFGELRSILTGRNRRQIVRALGAPPTAAIGFGVCVNGGQPMTYWQAPTWYYPYDPDRGHAIAIRFVGNRACEVEFIGAAAAHVSVN